MKRKRLLYSTLAIVSALALGPVANELRARGVAIADAGIVFPDGTTQTTAPIDLAAAARMGLTDICSVGFYDEQRVGCVFAAVPPGRILVVEHVSAHVSLPNGQSGYLSLHGGGAEGFRPLGFLYMAFQGLDSQGDALFISSQPIRMYLDEDELIEMSFFRHSIAGGGGGGNYTITGYYINK